MPIIEFFHEPCGVRYEKIFQFKEVTPDMTQPCPKCGEEVKRVQFSKTLAPHFYGSPDGFYRPSPTKRHSYKLAAADGNSSSAG